MKNRNTSKQNLKKKTKNLNKKHTCKWSQHPTYNKGQVLNGWEEDLPI